MSDTTPPTDFAVAEAIRAGRSRVEIERLYRFAEQRRRIVEAAGIDPMMLSTRARRILRWLSEWDDHTTDGLVQILIAVRSTGSERAGGGTVEPDRSTTPPQGDPTALEYRRAEIREARARLDAAFSQYDARWGRTTSTPEVEGPSL